MSQPEARLSRKIMTALRNEGAFVFKVHGGPMMMAGLPDIVGVYLGRFIAVETKMPGNKPSDLQLVIHDRIRAAGGQVVVAHSVDEALEVLKRRR
ncbi:holliday junction resolvase [Gordonia phage CherryonLim]|uniref:Holliday junction resolvase n=1 Tax=Gordonia phage CherryonLim TaxID=2652411 RepID=A0A5P8D9V3_9CAUD|nr:endonuclease [Gordonia phage CherryonLim]QFP95793.1 holliday junction resolvase [Gordonia phage CherryonLim]